MNEFPSRFGLFGGRIVGLYVYDIKDQLIAEYDRKWIVQPEKGTDAFELVKVIAKEHNFERKKRVA